MSSLWVVLDTRSQVGALRVGRVSEDDDVAAAALELTVEWPDGTVERLKLSKYFRKLRLDSLSAMVELAPEQLTKELEASPLPFARALAEKPRQRLRSRQLIDLVTVRAQVDPQSVEVSWKKHRKAFETLSQVGVEKSSSGPKYHLRDPLPPIDVPIVSPSQSEPSRVSASAGAKSTSPDSSTHETTSDAQDEQVVSPVAANTVSSDTIESALSQRNVPEIREDELDAWFASEAPSLAVADGATRLEKLRNQPDRFAQELSQYSLLVGRILKRSDARVSPEALARAFVALRRSTQETDRRRGLEALERATTVLAKPTEFLSRLDRPAFQAGLSELPLVDGSVRVRLLLLLAKSTNREIEDGGWWRGFDWSDVLDVSTGPISSVITASDVLMEMVRGAADRFASEVTTRRSLSVLLSGPRFALDHLTPLEIRSIFERVAESDGMFSRWYAEISATAERDELRQVAVEAQSEVARAHAEESRAVTELGELSEQLVETQRQFSALQGESSSLSTRERRQVLIDAAKVIAQVAATVDGDGRALDHDELTRKVGGLVERFGLRVDSHRGESVAFDPLRHTAPGTRPEAGEVVDVARAGYTWDHGDETVVVLPALVTQVGKSEDSNR